MLQYKKSYETVGDELVPTTGVEDVWVTTHTFRQTHGHADGVIRLGA